MKEFLLSLFTFSFCIIISAQKVDYDNTSKLFMGVNLGGTWNTTEVKYKLGAGWGLTLGKSYNYNYGKIVSFDIRARYLSGNWYGQDTSISSLADYSGTALSYYKPQGIIHNFKSKTRRLALELVVHLNGLTEKTGIDPYVFGGIGLTFNRTYGNLLQNDTSSIYQYPNDINVLDDTYESVLDDYDAKKYKVNVMPSFGFGLGYQIGKATTIGIEHKTTFTQKDAFDGVSNSSPRAKNDLYHYTSLYIQFRVNKTPRENPLPNQTISCPKPIIKFSNSSRDNSISTSPQFTINASVTNVAGMSNISLLNSSNIMVPYSYDSYSNQLSANVILNPGINIFTLTATNECGTEQKTITIQFKDCIDPSLSFINPISERTTVIYPSFTFSATINGLQSTQGILVYQNGVLLNNISYNPTTRILQSNVTLQPGLNTFTVSLTNNCGSTSSSTSVSYENCIKPKITSTNPITNSVVSLPALRLKATIDNITSKENITVTLNGRQVSTTTYNSTTKTADISLQLSSGTNTIIISATNNCGSDNESIIINLNDCIAPVITINGRNSTVSAAAYSLSASIVNTPSREGITVTLNGSPQNFTFSNGQLTSNINLQVGENKLIVSAVRNCGTDSKTIIINLDDCIAPLVTINGRNFTVSAAAYSLSANIVNMPLKAGITVTLNGSPQNFTFSNGQLTCNIKLQVGENKLIVSAIRNCGTDSKTITIQYKDCKDPSLSFINPISERTTVIYPSFTFSATINGLQSTQGILVYQNGVLLNNISYNPTTRILQSNVTLQPGLNTFTVSLTNNCGSTSSSTSVSYENCIKPKITSTNPITNSVVSLPALRLKATIDNITSKENITVTLNGRQVSTTTYNSTTKTADISLQLSSGTNTIIISATNNCGSDNESIIINLNDCIAPVITINGRNSTVSAAAYSLSASIVNTPSREGITVTLNGSPQNFTFSNGQLTSNINLQAGENKLIVSAVRNCGTDSKTINIIYTIPKPIPKPAVEEKKDAKPTTPIPERKGGG